MYYIRVQDEFCAAHLLHFADGSTEPLHGHNYKVEVTVACPTLDGQGIGVDYLVVHEALHRVLDRELDHVNLNSIAGLNDPNPTSENVARWIAGRMQRDLTALPGDARVHSVTVWETHAFGVTFEVPDSLETPDADASE
jgi:6-pyruvoyltetrahydropterin/6-carboxytetrahydropterin synthase